MPHFIKCNSGAFDRVKVVIITNSGKDKNQHKMLEIQQIFPKYYRCLFLSCFHNLEPQNAGLVDVKRGLH